MEENKEKSNNQIQWTTEKVMSTSALFISVISLMAIMYQSYLAREENTLIQKQQSASVLPYLSQWNSNINNRYKLIIGNKGVGPAFIKKVDIVYDSIHNFNNTDDLFIHISETNPGLDSLNIITSTFKKGYVLPANEIIELINISGETGVKEFLSVLSTKDIKLSIEYEDVYATRWRISTEDDSDVPVIINK